MWQETSKQNQEFFRGENKQIFLTIHENQIKILYTLLLNKGLKVRGIK